jgi:hypothetical protein
MQKRMREGLQRLSACGENDDDIPTDPCAHLFAPVEKELMRSCVRDAMLTMPDKVGGALYVAQNLGALWRCHGVGQHLLSWLCWRSFRMLGAMENEAETVEEIPHIRIEGICGDTREVTWSKCWKSFSGACAGWRRCGRNGPSSSL